MAEHWRPLTPDFRHLLLELAEQEATARFQDTLALRCILKFMAAFTQAQTPESLRETFIALREVFLATDDLTYIRTCLTYLYHTSDTLDEENWCHYTHLLEDQPALQEATMTFAERLIAKGRQEGRQEGEIRLLRRQLQQRFGDLPAWVEERLKEGILDDLEHWGERVLDAVILEDVFA